MNKPTKILLIILGFCVIGLVYFSLAFNEEINGELDDGIGEEVENCSIEIITTNVSYSVRYVCYIGGLRTDPIIDPETDIRCASNMRYRIDECTENHLTSYFGAGDGYRDYWITDVTNVKITCQIKRCCGGIFCMSEVMSELIITSETENRGNSEDSLHQARSKA